LENREYNEGFLNLTISIWNLLGQIIFMDIWPVGEACVHRAAPSRQLCFSSIRQKGENMDCSICGKSLEFMRQFGGVFSPTASVLNLGSGSDYDMWIAQVYCHTIYRSIDIVCFDIS